ncbi:hypothetical protein MA16_Dca026973 [Dendrobium catenatum]|uniref:Uncharacterized protein n=1 Tax=Dendrobium catenatum TaxID=906689 RepID=A0A2I0VBB8_9ASPA|nr:hypothetical protein MA16_Dca026973 [Dendrobium catenatum]
MKRRRILLRSYPLRWEKQEEELAYEFSPQKEVLQSAEKKRLLQAEVTGKEQPYRDVQLGPREANSIEENQEQCYLIPPLLPFFWLQKPYQVY